SGVHDIPLAGVVPAQGNGDRWNATAFELLKHVVRYVIGNKYDIGLERKHRFDIDAGQITGCRHGFQGWIETGESRAKLFFPALHDAYDLVRGTQLGQDIECLVLKHNDMADLVGYLYLATQLVGDCAVRHGCASPK